MLRFEDGVLVFLFLSYVMQLYAYRPLIYNYLEKYKIPYMQKMKTFITRFFLSFLSQDVVIFCGASPDPARAGERFLSSWFSVLEGVPVNIHTYAKLFL